MTAVSTLEMTVNAEPRVVGIVREFVARLSERLLGDPEIAAQIEIAVHELLDNATRYAIDGAAWVQVELRERAADCPDSLIVAIRTRNRVRAHDAERVASYVEQLRAIGDPLRFYLELMGRNKDRASGLGLGRVAAESEMSLDMTYNGDLLEVAAMHKRGVA